MQRRFLSTAVVVSGLAFVLWFATEPGGPLSAHRPGAVVPIISVVATPAPAPVIETPPAEIVTPDGVSGAFGQAPHRPAVAAPPGALPPSPEEARNAARPILLPEPSSREGAVDVEKIHLMLRDFRTLAGENPVGTNAEIMKAVMGENRTHARLGPPAGIQLNADGELVDRWGTPFFFHALSKDHMEIRSAGPDRIMWTGDDIVGQ